MAQFPNLFVKLSGFGMFENQWNNQKIHTVINYLIDCFSIDRCCFGSNFPVDKLYVQFNDLMNSYLSIFKNFSDNERDKVFYTNAQTIYQLEE